jgi:hypothetical protein
VWPQMGFCQTCPVAIPSRGEEAAHCYTSTGMAPTEILLHLLPPQASHYSSLFESMEALYQFYF